MKKQNNTVKALTIIFILSLLVCCTGSKAPNVYLSILDADGNESQTVLDPGNYSALPYSKEAPVPEKTVISVSFLGEQYEAEYRSAKYVEYGNYFYDYRTDKNEAFTVHSNGKVVGFTNYSLAIDENAVTAFSAEEIAQKAQTFFSEIFGEELAGQYVAALPDLTPGYVTVEFHLADEHKDARFVYVDTVKILLLPDGTLFGVLGRNAGRFSNKKIPDYFTDGFINNTIKKAINDDSVTFTILPGEMRLITVNNGVLACKIGIEAKKNGASQIAEIIIELED